MLYTAHLIWFIVCTMYFNALLLSPTCSLLFTARYCCVQGKGNHNAKWWAQALLNVLGPDKYTLLGLRQMSGERGGGGTETPVGAQRLPEKQDKYYLLGLRQMSRKGGPGARGGWWGARGGGELGELERTKRIWGDKGA